MMDSQYQRNLPPPNSSYGGPPAGQVPGPQPAGFHQGPPNAYNGPGPAVPPGPQFNGPMKAGMTPNQLPTNAVLNGPQGDIQPRMAGPPQTGNFAPQQFGPPRPTMPGMPPHSSHGTPPHSQPSGPPLGGPRASGPLPPRGSPASTGQITNQMGGMNLSGPPRGAPPAGQTSMPNATPPHNMSISDRGTPPSMIGARPRMPPHSSAHFNQPPTGMMPPQSSAMNTSAAPGMGPPPMGSVSNAPATSFPPQSTHSSFGSSPSYNTNVGPPPTSGFGPVPPVSHATSQGMEMNQQSFQGMSQPPGRQGYPNIGGPPTGPQHGGQQPPAGFPPTSTMQQPGQNYPPQSFSAMPGQQQMGGQQPMPGQQPMQGQQPMPGQQPMSGQPRYGAVQQQPQQKKLDPDQMPSPIQVMEDDKKNRSGVFETTTRGAVPPLITTPFISIDRGICNPKFIRSTMYSIPCTSDMLKSSQIPFSLSISPFAKLSQQEQPLPLVDCGESGPVRCKRCKAYINSFMLFIDGGRRFQCVFCGAATEVPPEYFNHLDHTGRRIDCYDRAELCLGSYEMTATKDYCKNSIPPKAPAFIFMIDVSYNSVKSGFVHLICDRLKNDILANLPREAGAEESEVRVGFVTYGKELHFYNVKGSLAQPQMLVVSDLEDMFVPLLDGFLVKLSESEAVIDSLLSQIPAMFHDSKETEIVLGPVLQAGLDALVSDERAGKLFIFHSSLPIAEAPGKLKNRDDRKVLGTEKEKTLLTPQNNFYTKLGQDCVAAGCSVDLFLFPNSYIDIASICELPRITGGNIYKYSYFQADLEGERFIQDLKRCVQKPMAFDAILRVRTSTGIRPVDFFGNFYMANTTDVELAAVDCDQTINVEIKHDDKLNESDGAFVQVAVLFTSVSGQRRLRIHNIAFNCCSQFADLFRNAELDTLINLMAKQAVKGTLNTNPKEVREKIMAQCAHILSCYRKNCANPSSAGQLILPECMKLLPLYTNCIIKSDGIQGGSEISTDDRSYLMHLINSMDVKLSNLFFYPRLLPLHNMDLDSNELPLEIRCSVERLKDDGVYLLENGISMFMWLGHNVDPDWVQKVFGVQSSAQIDIDKCVLFDLDNPVSHRVRGIVKRIRQERSRHMKLTIVRQRDKLEPWFNHFLVEDKGLNGCASYVDYLCHIHKEIRNLLS